MSELSKRIRAKFPGVYDDLDDATLEKAVLAKHPEYADLAQPEPQAAKPEGVFDKGILHGIGTLAAETFPGAAAVASGVKNHPVAAAGLVGGALAGPLTGGASIPAAMAATGLGAAGGAGLAIAGRQIASGKPEPALDTLKTMGEEGLANAAGEGAGRLATAGVMKGAKVLYKGVLRPSIPLQREFGDVAATGLREGVRVSDSGAQRLTALKDASNSQARGLIAEATAAGAPNVTTQEVANEFGPVWQKGRMQADLGRPDPRPAVIAKLKTFDARNPSGIPVARAQQLKTEAQDLASRAYRAEDRGGALTDLSADADKAMATGLRKGIEARVPDIADVNSRTQDLIGLERGLEDASYRNHPGVGVIRTLLGGFAPGATSGLAIGADRAAAAGGPSFTQALKAALVAALGGGDQ